jgi:YedE family putative selenium metabolism protein
VKDSFFDEKRGLVFTGAVMGILLVLLAQSEALLHTEFCLACFMDALAGTMDSYKVTAVQYYRTEIIGIILGAFLLSFRRKEFGRQGGVSLLTHFVLGFLAMIGILMFLGCPVRMVLRLGKGDFSALGGLAGLVVGVLIGLFFLKKGFRLKRNNHLAKFKGVPFSLVMVGMLILLFTRPLFVYFSALEPEPIRFILWLSLAVGMIIGILAQRTRFCLVGGFRDLFLIKDTSLLAGFLSLFLFVTVTNIISGSYQLGFIAQPMAHGNILWNFLGMVLVGWSSIFLGGCPFRQLILCGEGNINAVFTFGGMWVGSVFAHNFTLVSGTTGPTFNGRIAVIISLVILFIIAYSNTEEIKIHNYS